MNDTDILDWLEAHKGYWDGWSVTLDPNKEVEIDLLALTAAPSLSPGEAPTLRDAVKSAALHENDISKGARPEWNREDK